MERFEIRENSIWDNNKKQSLSLDELCGVLNEYSKSMMILVNEMNRINFGLETLDINIGLLSWLLDERCDEYGDMEKLSELSTELSGNITNLMYPNPKVEFEVW